MLTRKSLIKVFCIGMIILQLNCMFLKENESRCQGDKRLSSPGWQDDCAVGATEVTETGEPIGAAAGMSANATTEEATAEGTEAPVEEEAPAEETEGAQAATNETEAAAEAPEETMNATETGMAGETNQTNVTLQQGRAARRETAAERRAARKAAREARRTAAKSVCPVSAEDATLRQKARKADRKTSTLRQGQRKATLRQAPVAAEQPSNVTEIEQPAAEETNATAPQETQPAQPAQTTNGGRLNERLQDLIGSIKETQDVTIRQLDELKNSDLLNIGGTTGAKKEVPATNETAAEAAAPEETTGAEETEGATEGTEEQGETEGAAAGAETGMANATEATGAMTEGTNETAAGTPLRGGRLQRVIFQAETGAGKGEETKTEGSMYERPMSPCKLKRRIARKLRREARKSARNQNCMLQKQWDLIENMKVSAPTISNAISDACTVVRAKASDNSIAQGLTESRGSETATANGSGNSISVANAIGTTKSLTDSRAMRDSNSVGVTQSNTTGTADSTGSNGSVSIANNKNTNMNTNELCAADNSNTVGRTSSTSTGAATSNASDKSLASANSLDKSTAQSKLIAEDKSISVGNTEVASNTKATSTSANQSKAQTVAESTGEGITDLKAKKDSRAVGNLDLTSSADTTADAVNGGNALGTAQSKTCGANEGAADNNSTVILNNRNANTASSNSRSAGTLEAAPEANVTEITTGPANVTVEEQPAGVSLEGGRPLTQAGNQTEQAEETTGTEEQAEETAGTQEQAQEEEMAQESETSSEMGDMSCDFGEEVMDIKSMGMGFDNICDSEIKAAKETETDMGTETEASTETEGAAETNGATLRAERTTGVAEKAGKTKTLMSGSERTESTCDMGTTTLKTQRASDLPLGQGIFRGDAHTKNICRHMCERMNMPRVTRAEIKSGNDGLTIFRCLCGSQYTSWFKPNYGVSPASADKKLTRREKRRSTRRATRRLRQKRAADDQTCGTTGDRATLRTERRTQREADRTTLRTERGMENGTTGYDMTKTTTVDMKPVVDQFIVNNANHIKSQSADYLNKIQDLLAAKTGGESNGNKLTSGSNGNGVC